MRTKTYNPASRKRAVNSAWQRDRRVRILHPAFGFANKIGTVASVGAERIYVRIRFGKKPDQWTEVAYLPEHLRLISRSTP